MTRSFEDVVAKLVAAHQRESKPPWSPRDDDAVENELRRVVQAVSAELQVEFRAEFGHYGSGYASFVDAWFFRRDGSFRRSVSGDHFTGLVALLSRLAPVYCFLEGEKSWASNGSSSSYLPSFEGVALGYEETVRWLERKVERCHPDNVPAVRADLEAAREGLGSTLFDILVEIIQAHGIGGDEAEDCVELRLA